MGTAAPIKYRDIDKIWPQKNFFAYNHLSIIIVVIATIRN